MGAIIGPDGNPASQYLRQQYQSREGNLVKVVKNAILQEFLDLYAESDVLQAVHLGRIFIDDNDWHVTLGDGNCEDGNIKFCMDGYSGPHTAESKQFGEILLSLELVDRETVIDLINEDIGYLSMRNIAESVIDALRNAGVKL